MKNKTITKADPEPPPAAVPIRDSVSVTVNPPFRGTQYAANKKLTEEDLQKLETNIPEAETLLFVIMGDLNIGSRYAKSFLAVTDKLIYGFDDSFDGGVRTHSYDSVW